jgi:hypothetical protein
MRRGALFAGALFAGALFGETVTNATVASQVYGGRQAKRITEPSVEHVLESWDWLEWQRAQQAQARDKPEDTIKPKAAPVDPAGLVHAAGDAETASILSAQIHQPVAVDPAALAALQRRNRMAMILAMALDDDDD